MNAFWIMLDSLRREHVRVCGLRVCQTQRLLRYLGYFSYAKLPQTQFETVREAYEWAHTAG